MKAKIDRARRRRRSYKTPAVERTMIQVDTQKNHLILPHGYEVRRSKR